MYFQVENHLLKLKFRLKEIKEIRLYDGRKYIIFYNELFCLFIYILNQSCTIEIYQQYFLVQMITYSILHTKGEINLQKIKRTHESKQLL